MGKQNKTVEIELAIKAALYEPAPWHKTTEEVVAMLCARNARRAVAGKASPVAGKVLARILNA